MFPCQLPPRTTESYALRSDPHQPQPYALGNLMSAQFFDAAVRAHPSIPSEIEAGELATLRGWLAKNIHVHGRALTADQIVERATGAPLSTAPYLAYLRNKYGALYDL